MNDILQKQLDFSPKYKIIIIIASLEQNKEATMSEKHLEEFLSKIFTYIKFNENDGLLTIQQHHNDEDRTMFTNQSQAKIQTIKAVIQSLNTFKEVKLIREKAEKEDTTSEKTPQGENKSSTLAMEISVYELIELLV